MSLCKNCRRWKNFDCIFEFSVKSYVGNTINLSCSLVLFIFGSYSKHLQVELGSLLSKIYGIFLKQDFFCAMQSSYLTCAFILLNPLAPSDPYMGHTAQLTSRRCILNTCSTNVCPEYFKCAA
jgi:hypothetical protein